MSLSVTFNGAALSADPNNVENADQPGRPIDVERQYPLTRTEYGLAERGVVTGRQHDRIPRLLGKVGSSFHQRVTSILR